MVVGHGSTAMVSPYRSSIAALMRERPLCSSSRTSAGLSPTIPATSSTVNLQTSRSGDYRPFAHLARDCLQGLAPDRIGEPEADLVLGAFRQLDPHPDVEPALRLLRDAGVPAVTLTNGSADLVAALTRRAGLDGYLRTNLSVDAVRRWKPAPEPYRYAADELGVDPGRLALVAAHAWDCAGAARAGLRAGWIPRTEPRWPTAFPSPDVTAGDMSSLIAMLLGLPATGRTA
jgi:2-haloacid dehalogenase